MYCINCGEQVVESARFCAACGTTIYRQDEGDPPLDAQEASARPKPANGGHGTSPSGPRGPGDSAGGSQSRQAAAVEAPTRATHVHTRIRPAGPSGASDAVLEQRPATWHYRAGGVQTGPLSLIDFLSAASSGVVTGATLVWRPGMTDWRPARELAELADVLSTTVGPNVSKARLTASTRLLSLARRVVGIACLVLLALAFMAGLPGSFDSLYEVGSGLALYQELQRAGLDATTTVYLKKSRLGRCEAAPGLLSSISLGSSCRSSAWLFF